MTVVITQCRLSSTRLPRKALKDLGGKSVLEWVLNSMKKVKADAYYLATDEESLPELESVAKRCGWQVFAGPKEDVLERFCLLIEKVNADVVVRATADNPFLFYEAAQALLDEYEAENKKSKVDYITWTGLPHGSGVEIFNAHSLLNAKDNTKSPYDHEHVGPALYKHTDLFNCVFKNSPARWNYPELRTTIDTHADYVRAQLIYRHVKKSLFEAQADARNVPDSSLEPFTTGPFTTEQIVSAFDNPEIKNMILLVPCVKKGKGTGHLMRCLRIASKTGATVYIPQNADLAEKDSIIQSAYNYGLEPWQITEKLPSPGEYGVIFTDVFSLNRVQASVLYSIAPVVALDEGSEYTEYCDYLFNVIPPLSDKDEVNLFDSRYISLPSKRRTEPRPKNASEIKTVLISIGGEDPLSFAIPASMAFARLGKKVTTVKKGLSSSTSLIPDNLTDNLKFSEPFENLMDQLYKYDLVVTHYGLTAYEACAAGCAVLLVGTSELHIALANKYGFVCVNDFNMSLTELNQILENTSALYKYEENEIPLIKSQKLSSFVTKLTSAKRMACPVCANSSFVVKNKLDPVVARTA
ncbi:MAG: NTP transferase domain-containing protein, partial [Treponema sp.]|nr:NTP transferase domain-containing protein [Treponema sp.]